MASKKPFDVFQENKSEYAISREPVLLTVKPARYLAIEGRGRPGDEQFQGQMEALHSVA